MHLPDFTPSAPRSLLRRVTRLAAPLLLVASATASAQPAASQAIDVQQYKPAPGAHDVLGMHGARIAPHLSWNLGASLNYADDPLNLVDPRADRFLYRIVDSQLTLDLMGAISLFDRVELGFALPISHTTSEPAAAVAPDLASGVETTGVGDLRLVPKVRLLSTDSGIHLAVTAPFTVPTGGGEKFLGSDTLTFQPRFVAEWATTSLRLLANVGFNVRREEQLRNLRVGNEFAYAVGAEVPLSRKLTAQATLAGALGLKETSSEERPMEVLAALKYRFTEGLAAHVGAGPGLTRGYGTPSFRVLGGVAWTPFESRSAPAAAAPVCDLGPEDFDGFQDDDHCLDPDDDGDGIPDVTDVCPTEPETVNGFQDEDGCPDDPNAHQPSAEERQPAAPPAPLTLPPPPVDTDGDGLVDSEDLCPNAAEDTDGFEDEDGCPDPDNDQDGIPDAEDQCPLEAETINGVKDDDGCPDKGKARVRVEGARIVILDKVYFATGRDVILARSHSLLRQVASTLKANPRIERVRVEGHTDDRGADAKNLDLSQRRAKNVVAFLVKAGIAAERLEAVGYGEAKPVDTNKTAKGRENNRRVEFNIVKVAEPSAGGGTR
ncbi:OmpA family protein [Corallococcus macrosporus]|uniref:Cell envelope biogenesis protein OmpA n=1 Tax=Corallococcus macrosporus DSM 14697 TaxID=1189310 RepID=A0A250JXT9_9BACT|nr:OmpA family protein [Corallococcus macrosporus]ATB48543.1 cell envelope biogenesis protein OmpA [Corallococcus macrosporus DSM 14697]